MNVEPNTKKEKKKRTQIKRELEYIDQNRKKKTQTERAWIKLVKLVFTETTTNNKNNESIEQTRTSTTRHTYSESDESQFAK